MKILVEDELVRICIAAGYEPEQHPNRHGRHFRSKPEGIYLFDFSERPGYCGRCLNCQTMLARIAYYPKSINGAALLFDPCTGRDQLIPLDDPRSFEKIEALIATARPAGWCQDYE